MERDDPQERIADLERQLAEQKRAAGADALPAPPADAFPNPGSQWFNAGQQVGPQPAGWYPEPSGEPGTRYWDGHNWTVANAWRTRRRRRSIWRSTQYGIAIFGAALFAVVGFWSGANDFNQYRVGTPTTATVTDCSGGRGGHCSGMWSIDGVRHKGDIKAGFSTPRAGSSLDVRVRNDTAYTPRSWVPNFVFGGVFLVAGISVIWPAGRRDR